MKRRRSPATTRRTRAWTSPSTSLNNKPPTANSKGLRFGGFVQGRDVIEEEMEAVLQGKKDAKAAMDEAVKRGNEILRKFEAANK
jgi:sn-glycerol 3-phosphate transport system substrate-binding protein